jgi:hypothetical protein
VLGEKQVTDGLQTVFGGAGVTCLVTAVIGGNVKVAGSELPIVNSPVARILLAILGVVLIAASLWRNRPRMKMFLVRQPTSSISWAEGPISNPTARTRVYGGQVVEVKAAGYRKSEDGKSYTFVDRRDQSVKELPSWQVESIERSDKRR